MNRTACISVAGLLSLVALATSSCGNGECVTDSDCPEGRCFRGGGVLYRGGTCVSKCEVNANCPEGETCVSGLCVNGPSANALDADGANDIVQDGTGCTGDERLGNACRVGTGSCRRLGEFVCDADVGDVVCSATPGKPSPEVCNQKDDDCDGVVDDLNGTERIDYDTHPEHCGRCGNDCTERYAHATGACRKGGCFLPNDGCDDGYVNLDGEPSNGCEYECNWVTDASTKIDECFESDCSNGKDDEGDGDTDCEDADCEGEPSGDGGTCPDPAQKFEGRTELTCTDLVDNDADGKTDCYDLDCEGARGPRGGACPSNRIDFEGKSEATCDDRIDNDADGETDCQDPDCTGKPSAEGGSCPTDPKDYEDGYESSCADQVDNDADGDTDCEDRDCAGVGNC